MLETLFEAYGWYCVGLLVAAILTLGVLVIEKEEDDAGPY